MREHPVIKIEEELSVVRVFRGQTITIYAHPNEEFRELEGGTQLEIRVHPDTGELEIFANTHKLKIKNFEDWYSINPHHIEDTQ